ncbi:transposase [Leptolyngbya sp. AN03gr2]|uniref:transposase n=1 Tax=unclassified Leptolyngbya TaxID=2650499 RepID=UPI003D31B9C1
MSKITTTLKLKFLDLNQVKADLFAQMTQECTDLANELLKLSKQERRKTTTAKVVSPLMSAVTNQVIRATISRTKVKQFKKLPPEINTQNWKLEKRGETYSVSFPTLKGVKRVPLLVAYSHYQSVLDKLIAQDATIEGGTLKIASVRGCWYALMSVTQDVPDKPSSTRAGIDRGQNNLAVVVLPNGKCLFFSGRYVKHRRRQFQKLYQSLQKAGKRRALKRLKRSESQWMKEVNHAISKRIADFANRYDADVVLEDLEEIRHSSKQRKKNKSHAGENRDFWAYFQLGQFIQYKVAIRGRQTHIRPAPYTSKSDHRNGILGQRNKHQFIGFDGYECNADWNAGLNLSQWDGFACPLGLYVSSDGVFEAPQSFASVSLEGVTLQLSEYPSALAEGG